MQNCCGCQHRYILTVNREVSPPKLCLCFCHADIAVKGYYEALEKREQEIRSGKGE